MLYQIIIKIQYMKKVGNEFIALSQINSKLNFDMKLEDDDSILFFNFHCKSIRNNKIIHSKRISRI